MNALCDKITDILRWECKKVTYTQKGSDTLLADLDCYAITAVTAGKIAVLSRDERLVIIITIQSIEDPKLQLKIRK